MLFSFVLEFTTPRFPQPGSHLSVHKVFHLLKEEISQVCHCPAASSQNSQARHQPVACPKQDAVLQQTFQLDAPCSTTVEGKLITTSLYYPKLWNIAWIYSFPDAFNCPRSGRIHQEDHMGGSCKAASSINKQKDFSYSDCMTIKTGSTLNTDRHEQCPRASSHSHTATSALSKADRGPLEHHSSCCPVLHLSLLCQDSQQARWPSCG